MSRFLILVCLATSPAATAFVSSPVARQRGAPALRAAEGTDFDAPVPFDPQSGTAVLDHEPIVDDECYMGKDGSLDECADFDPPVRKRDNDWTNAQDAAPRYPPPRWAFGDDYDAPVPANPQVGTAVLTSQPIVDDECYMGKEGTLDECADFDPPKRTRSANAQDPPRDAPKWTQSFQDIFADIVK